jgi:hypothetical protein
MKSRCLFALGLAFLPMAVFSLDSLYCPYKQGYLSIGMTDSQVLELCGPPIGKQTSSEIQVSEKIPETQLIYTTLNQGANPEFPGLTSYYTMWSLPSGSQGTSLRFSVINNKVVSVDINGSGTNASTICGGVSVQTGDDISKVYSACGDPSLVNQTYIKQPVSRNQNPQVWIYQFDQYQPTVRLTFINGKLQSIE